MVRSAFFVTPRSMVAMLLAAAAVVFSLSLVVAMSAPATASGALIQAHRGGPNIDGAAAFPENSMSAFRHSIKKGWMIEFDVEITDDGVLIVMHDPTLKRTTDCPDVVSLVTWNEIKNCELDTIGIGSAKENLDPGDPRRESIPTLANVLTLLEKTRGRASIEVKPLSAEVAQATYRQLAASKIPSRRVYIQNFYPPNLVDPPSLFPGAKVVLLVTEAMAGKAIDSALKHGADAVSPGWPFAEDLPGAQDFVTRAHSEGLPVIPWTIDDAENIQEAAAAGVDGIISNDPTRAYRLVGTDWPRETKPKLKAKLKLQVKPVRVRVRKGKVVRIQVRIRNRGKGASGRIRLKALFPKKMLRSVGKKKRVIKSIPKRGSRILGFRFRTGKKARPGRVAKVRFRLSERRKGKMKVVAKRAAKVRFIRKR